MDCERTSIKKFNRYFLLGELISLGLLIFGFIFINEKQDKIIEVAGWFFLALGMVFIFIFLQRRQRLLWIYKNISPVPMKMNLKKIDDSDSTNYVAYLTRQDITFSKKWKTKLYPPSCNVQLFLNTENQVQVYIDPNNNNPAIIRTTEGLFWVMAGSGAVQDLQDSQ